MVELHLPGDQEILDLRAQLTAAYKRVAQLENVLAAAENIKGDLLLMGHANSFEIIADRSRTPYFQKFVVELLEAIAAAKLP